MPITNQQVAGHAFLRSMYEDPYFPDHVVDGGKAILLRLCERELADREQRACQRRLRAARFPQLKSLDDFDFTAQPSLNRALVLELARCEFIDRRESVILLGGPGTGKTHVAVGLAAAACQRGKRVRFFRVTELITQLLEAREDRALGRLRSQLDTTFSGCPTSPTPERVSFGST